MGAIYTFLFWLQSCNMIPFGISSKVGMLYSLKNEHCLALKKKKKNVILLVKSSLSGIRDKWKEFWLFLCRYVSHKQRAISHVTTTWLFTETTDLITKQVKKQTNKASFSSCLDSLLEFTFPFTSPTIPDIECQMLVSLKDRTLDNLNISKIEFSYP